MLHYQYKQALKYSAGRKPIKINDNRYSHDFIGGTLNYVTYVML